MNYKLQCSATIIGTIATNYPRTNERPKAKDLRKTTAH